MCLFGSFYGHSAFLTPVLTTDTDSKDLRYQRPEDGADERQATARQKDDEQLVSVHRNLRLAPRSDSKI